MQGGVGTSGTSSGGGTTGFEQHSKDSTAGRSRSGHGKRRPIDEEEARRRLAASRKLYYRIGEVSELTGVKAHVLRYWETEFRWMAPPKSRSKQRLYRKRDIEFVWLLKKLLWDQRYTIAGARQRIQELGLEEALTRCADDASLDAALLSRSAWAIGVAAAPSEAGGTAIRPPRGADEAVAGTDASGSEAFAGDASGEAIRDWTGLAVALESIQNELLELRGALQQGL